MEVDIITLDLDLESSAGLQRTAGQNEHAAFGDIGRESERHLRFVGAVETNLKTACFAGTTLILNSSRPPRSAYGPFPNTAFTYG